MGLETYFSSPGLPSPTRPKAFQYHIISSISWWCSKKRVLVLLGGFLERQELSEVKATRQGRHRLC